MSHIVDSNRETWDRKRLLQAAVDCALEAKRTAARGAELGQALAQASLAFTALAVELRSWNPPQESEE